MAVSFEVMITGSHTVVNYSFMEPMIVSSLKGRMPSSVRITHFNNKGADRIAERFAKSFKMKTNKITKSRSENIVEEISKVDAVLLLWDGHQDDVIAIKSIAETLGKWVKVIQV